VEPSDPVVIGVIVAPHGVRGAVRVRPSGSGRHLREDLEPVVAGRRRRISRVRETPRGFLVDLEGVVDRTGAAALKGEELVLERRELDTPQEGEFYVGDLMGLVAMNETGEILGTVDETFETPAHEILVVRKEGDVLYVPFTLEHVPEVDLDARHVVVRPPEG
jgi:16S rRNA processing protein RimM